MLREFYKDKTILVTGTTGFIGKVLLESILRKLPEFRKMYILVRHKPKSGFSLQERVNNEIIGSHCFSRWKEENPDWQSSLSKIVPISGDLVKENLGMTPEDRAMITEDCQVIFNIAASVDFNSRLDQAIEINIDGALRMQQLAKECKNIEIFTHMSTAYVNSDKRGYIEEKIYEVDFDVEEHINYLKTLSVEEIEKQTPAILGEFPNTYTFTKSMSERLMRKHRGNLPTFIIRPSIVGCAYKEPFPGWVDNISAAGAMVFFVGLGVIRDGIGEHKNKGDLVPVDFVVNGTLIGAAHQANQDSIVVHNSGSSASSHPLRWIVFVKGIERYFTSIPYEQQFTAPNVAFTPSRKKYEFWFFIRNKLPQKFYSGLGKVLFSKNMKKNAERLKKINQKGKMVNYIMSHFTLNEWIFDHPILKVYQDSMNEEERKNFWIDINNINWEHYTYLYCYGMQTYVVKQKGIPVPDENFNDVIAKKPKQTYFNDILWATSKGKVKVARKQKDVVNIIVNSPNVREAMKTFVATPKFQKDHQSLNEKESLKIVEQDVRYYAEELCAKMRKGFLKSTAWATHKILKRVYDKIIVDMTDLNKIKDLQENSRNPVLLMPTRKSYMDMLLIAYIFFANDMDQPFFSTPIQYTEVKLINRIFRNCGSFFVRENEEDELYQIVLREYLSILMSDKQTISISLEETRQKSGMLGKPNPVVFKQALESFFNGKASDVDIIPMTINYDRVLEGETFPYELVGEAKVKESLTRFIASARYIGTPFGKVCINFGKKISLRQYTQDLGIQPHLLKQVTEEDKVNVCGSLCRTIQELNTKHSVVMSTGPLAACLLEYRKGISQENMVKQIEYIYNELKARGALVAEQYSATRDLSSAMTLLTEFVKKKRDVFEPFVSPRVDYKNILMLAYYKNSIVHLFFKEMVVGVSLLGFGKDTIKTTGITKERIWEKVQFLSQMLDNMFIQESVKIKSYEDFETTLEFMERRGVLHTEFGMVKYETPTDKPNGLVFLCSMIWPFIDSYWLTIVYIYTLLPDKHVQEGKILSKIQWFAESLYEDNIVLHYESCSFDIITKALDFFLDQKVIVKEEFEDEGVCITLNSDYKKDEDLIQQMFDKVSFFKKLSLIKFTNLKTDIQKTLLGDFPMTSNL